MNQKSYISFYELDYRKLFYGEPKPVEEIFQLEYERGKSILSFLQHSGIINGKKKNLFIFEVGCGSGGILKNFKEMGFTVGGCDLDKNYLEYGKKKYNLNLHYGTIKQISFDRIPDILIYSHVLEHILYPNEELAQIHNILNEKGYLYIEVPGIENLIESYEMNFLQSLHCHHVYYYSLVTLKNLLSLNGFRLINAQNTIKTVFKKIEYIQLKYIIKNNYNTAMKYLEILEKSRRILLIKKVKRIINEFIKRKSFNYERLKKLPKELKEQIISLLQRYIKQIRFFKSVIYKISKKINN